MTDFLKENEQLEDLQYKGYKLIQKKSGFRFGVDAVLAAWYSGKNITSGDSVIDLGTGSGIIAVLIAARTGASAVAGLEIQDEMAEMAQRSVAMNLLEDRVRIVRGDLRCVRDIFPRGSFSHVVTNPPYKKGGSGILNPADNKALSRHEIACSLEDVIKAANWLLRDNGIFTMIHRPERLNDIVELMRQNKIEPKYMKFVHPSAGKAPNLLLVRGVRGGRPFLKIEEPLYIFNSDGTYTDEINNIYNRSDLNG